MNSRIEKAFENRKKGYNCAQSVICAYCDILGTDENTAFALSEGFGGGMGGMQETCGAVSAIFMLAGLIKSSADVTSPTTKAATYALVREFAQKFKEKNSSLICKELKGLTGKPMLRSCEGCIEDACQIFEDYLKTVETSQNLKTKI